MRTKKIWTVVWTHYNNESRGTDPVDWREVCSEYVDRFPTEQKAKDFARFVSNHSEPAEPFCEDVPVHIARRWGF